VFKRDMPKSAPLSLAELLQLLPRIQSTLELLVGAQQAQSRAPSAANGKKPARRRRSGDSKLANELLAIVSRHKKGLSLGEIEKASKADRGAIQYHLRALRQAKKAKLVGTRRTARWLAA
jgi:hypothetical protein